MFSTVSRQQAQRFLQLFADNDFKGIRFRQFSKFANPALQRYAFGFSTLLN
jgi:hypothetical protein